jgi:large subunit ribosomal protein L30
MDRYLKYRKQGTNLCPPDFPLWIAQAEVAPAHGVFGLDGEASMAKALIKIVQTGSPIRCHHRWRTTRTLIGLRLNRIGRIAELPDTPQTWSMIRKVRHLVKFVDEHLFEEHRLVRPQEEDEETDKRLMRKLVFDPRKIVLQPFNKEEMRAGKSPDFRLFKDNKLRGYCELKSPRDDWVFDFTDDLEPAELRVDVRPDPAAHNLARNIGKAAAQFDAVNPDHSLPNILVLVSHARRRGPADLKMAIEGIQVPGGHPLFLLLDEKKKDPKKAWKQEKLWEADVEHWP